jgi:tubulin delta
MNIVRREAEKCDMLKGFLMLQSLGGGTGSGLGAYMLQAVKDEFGAIPAVNTVIWPHSFGEVIL